MPLSLAHLPREVLVLITSFLPDAGTISRLYATGNRHFMGLLTNGGVTHLELAEKQPLGRVFNFIPILRLDSISIGESCLPDASLKALILELPSTLLRLEVVYNSPSTFWRLADSPFQETPLMPLGGLMSHFVPHDQALWSVKDSFPNLQVLKIVDDGSSSELDIFSMVFILCGLPDTLVELSLGFLENCGFAYYSLLPPGLECLSFEPFATPSPPTQKHEHHLRHLTSLRVGVSELVPNSESRTEWLSEEALGPWHAPMPSPTEVLWLPPALTDLHLHSASLQKMTLLSDLPGSLVTLNLSFNHGRGRFSETDLYVILGYVPPSVASLCLYGLNVLKKDSHSEALGDTQSELVKLQALKRFELHGSLPSSTHLKLLKSMPTCIEKFSWYPRSGAQVPLALETLMQFVAPRLLTLVAPLAYDCFPHQDKPYPLASLFPDLRELCILDRNPLPKGENFNFAAIPPTVTYFESSVTLSSDLLHLLPSSVKELELPELKVSTESEFYNLISTGFTHPKEVLRLEYPLYGDVFRSQGDIDEPLFSGTLSWPENHDFPSTVTELLIGLSSLSKPSFNPNNLPCLKKLTWYHDDSFDRSQILVGAFKTLEELDVPSLSSCNACPPNLTRLMTMSDVPGNFNPLPASLTHLECTKLPRNEWLLRLPSLRVYRGPLSGSISFFLQLTSSITSLTVLGACIHGWSRDDMESFYRHFSSLQDIAFAGITSMKSLELILQVRPVQVSIKATTVGGTLEKVDSLAAIAGIGIGQLPCYPGDSLDDLLRRMVHTACNALSPKLDLRIDSSPEPTLSLLPYLSSSFKDLSMHFMTDLFRQDMVWPSITSLKCSNSKPYSVPSNVAFNLPATLTMLIINQSFVCTNYLLASIPSSLTHLEIPNASKEHILDSWPPSLTRLAIAAYEEDLEDVLAALPTSLRYLELTKIVLEFAWLPLIPEYVERLKVDLNVSSALNIAKYAKKRGNLTVIPSNEDFMMYLEGLSPELGLASVLDNMVSKLRSNAR